MLTCKFSVLLKFKLKYKLNISRRLAAPAGSFRAAGALLLTALLIAAALLLCIFVPYVILLIHLAGTYTEREYFSLLLTFANAAVFILSLLSAYSLFSSGREREFLIPLPIKKRYIFASEYVTYYFGAVMSSLLFTVPGAAVYAAGMAEKGAPVLILKAVLGCIIFPALPSAAAFVMISVVFAASARFRHRETAAVILGAAVLICAVLLRVNIGSFNADGGPAVRISESLSRILFNSYFMLRAIMIRSLRAWLYMLYFTLSSAAVCAAVYFYGGAVYDRILGKMKSAVSAREKTDKDYRQRSPARAFCIKEFKTVLRSPAFALNCCIGVILAPVLAVTASRSGLASDIPGIIMCLVIMSANMTASTSISREGRSFGMCVYMPVRSADHIKGRAAAAFVFNALSGALFIFPYEILIKLNFLYIIYEFLTVIAASLTFACFGLLIDLKKPKLIWDRETEAVKQNFNAVLGMIVSIMISLVIVIPFFVGMAGHVSKTFMYLCSFAEAAAAAAVGVMLLRNKACSREGNSIDGNS